MMSQFADLVGMTMASEAIIAQELEMPYASLCSVDNFAHGLGETELTMEEIPLARAAKRRNHPPDPDRYLTKIVAHRWSERLITAGKAS